MTEHRNPEGTARSLTDVSGAEDVAKGDANLSKFTALISKVLHAAKSPDRKGMQVVMSGALDHGVRAQDIADIVIPAAARQLGDAWCEDEIGFATVTIGTARLQSALRNLGPNWSGDHTPSPDAPRILIIVAENIYHTLGAAVLAGQLRRLGISVKVLLSANYEQARSEGQHGKYDAIFISASCDQNLEILRKIVDSVKIEKKCPPVIIGGQIVTTENDVRALTGADCVTNDPLKALQFCGLRSSLQTTAPAER